jgi:hypothetical protein
MAGDIDTRKSTRDIVFFLGDSPVTWQSAKQKVIALSSSEAEYIAAAVATCLGVWLARLLSDLVGVEAAAPEIRVDMSGIALAKNPVFHDHSKHIDVRYHYIWSASNGEGSSLTTSPQRCILLMSSPRRLGVCASRSCAPKLASWNFKVIRSRLRGETVGLNLNRSPCMYIA